MRATGRERRPQRSRCRSRLDLAEDLHQADYVGLFEYALDAIDERCPALFCFVVEPQCEDARRASPATLLGT
jgi:hypothetical protein